MKVAVIGAGAIGGFFGSQLIKSGHDVSFVSRGSTADMLEKSGLTLNSGLGSEFFPNNVYQVLNSEDQHWASKHDGILLCVKTYSNPSTVELMNRLSDANTWVLTLQNGLNPEKDLQALGVSMSIIQGIAYIETTQTSPGNYVQYGDIAEIVYGSRDPALNGQLVALRSLFAGSRSEFKRSPDIVTDAWIKFMFISTVAGVTSCTQTKLDCLFREESWISLTRAVLKEIEEVAQHAGVSGKDLGARAWDFIVTNQADIVASMHTDLVSQKPLELDALTGSVCEMGRQLSVPTPLNQLIYAALAPYKLGKD